MKIYKITNIKNNKSYVGMTNGKREHYFGSGIILEKAIKKYGKNSFTMEIIEECSDNMASERETFWIKQLNTLIPDGYNISLGGTGGDTISHNPRKDSICQQISDTLIASGAFSGENNPMFGKFGEEHPAYGIKHSPESVVKRAQKLSEFLQHTGGNRGIKNPMFGRSHTEDSIKKMKANRPDYSGDKNPNYKGGKSAKAS